MEKSQPAARRWIQRWTKKDRVGYLFIFPAVFILFVFTIIPLICSFFISLTDLDIFLATPDFVGLENFKRTFEDERVWNALKNTFYYTVISVPVQLVIALVLAYWLYKPTRFNKLCRTVFYIPVLCSFTAIGILFSLLLNSTVGYIPYLISLVTGEPIALLSDTRFAMPIIIFISVWKSFGKTLIILVSGINDIPSNLFEASEIDGASKTQQFFRITLPNLLPTINFTLLTSIIGAFQVFDVVYVTTGGGPLFKTETMVQYIYQRGFSNPYELGYASAMCVELFLIIAVIVLFFKGYMERKIAQNT
ncbi:carbohydrate ABC transporter permease [Marvinbryantia formatexigens]|nr:sugar ABC transporter permease [Marvinbryantia formatexigens]UWO25391.1 sugar ABC transporter permease [Marvinbryantia formatexigens DSM 14469]SDG73417.1 multiple sugar transport system permease protein [Marvinbryantia formatexigens]